MTKTFKIVIYSIISLIGLVLYFLTYILVPKSLDIANLKYVIMIIGYLSVIVFPIGFYNLINEIRKQKNKN